VTRGRWAALVVVLIAAAAAFGVSLRTGDSVTKAPVASLAPLRQEAGLSSCPTGISKDLPELTLGCLGGGPAVALRGAPSGKPTLVNVYGSWCAPCLREMPILVAFAQASAGKVSLLGVDTEDEQRLALIFAKQVGQSWNAVIDPNGEVLRKFAAGPPVTLFVDAAGAIKHVQVGAFTGLPQIAALTKQYLGVAT
jgi:cytochrome c biogenesis protein CcmG/thiol:disulfide interchange protein DsbE